MVEYVRLSLGTAIALGLEHGPDIDFFTTLFVMTYSEQGCSANCAFCPQASTATGDKEKLSRIGWPKFSRQKFQKAYEESDSDFQRLCIQALNYPEVVDDCIDIMEIVGASDIPVSLCIHPIAKEQMQRLRDTGVNRIGIAIDACTPHLFSSIKGEKSEYSWKGHIEALSEAAEIWGRNNVTTHLIVGLGETEQEAAEFLFQMKDLGVRVGLFAFTSIEGTKLVDKKQPKLSSYRRIQILRDLLLRGKIDRSDISFKSGRVVFRIDQSQLTELLSSGNAFRVTGCPGCNRPFYNERPSGPIFNYPRPLQREEVIEAVEEAGLVN